MANPKTLLKVPELVEAVNQLVSNPISPEDIFRLIGTGEVKPLGFAQRIPLFSIEQVGVVVRLFQLAEKRSQQRALT